MIQQFGIGLAAAIFIDAFVVRTILVPALMHLFGRGQLVAPALVGPGHPPPQCRGCRYSRPGPTPGPR